MRLQLIVLLVVTLASGTACGRPKSPTTPTPPPAGNPPPASPVLSRISISGNVALAAIGETSALTATAHMSDGTTANVTASAVWKSNDASTVSVSPAGLLTVVRYGATGVQATYQGKSAFVRVTATPAGTFVVLGRVREPGSGGVPGVRVVEPTSGASANTSGDGSFSLASLTSARVTFDKDGFESGAIEGKPNVFNDVPMQKVIRIAAGAPLTLTLAPHDMDYAVGADVRCHPCRMLRVVTTDPGTLRMRLTWVESRSILNLWANGRAFEGTGVGPSELAGELQVAAGETIVYVGVKRPLEVHIPLTLTTTLVK